MKCSEQVNPQRHKIDKWITGVEGEVEWRVIAFFGGGWKCSKLSGDWCTILGIYSKPFNFMVCELYLKKAVLKIELSTLGQLPFWGMIGKKSVFTGSATLSQGMPAPHTNLQAG